MGLMLRYAFLRVPLLASVVVGVCSTAFAQPTTVYAYDSLGRLISVDYPSGQDRVYCYDAAGNRLEKKATGTCSGGAGSNTPPVANNDGGGGVAGTAVDINVTANDTDADGDSLSVVSVTQPSSGTVAILSASTVRVYLGSVGNRSFQYTISDGNGGVASATVYVTSAPGCTGQYC
ncbi:Ig-like domain-containing protein [Parvularcula sp. LCG005]|uniref:Ig-like domain-containing protein n=1 Tax=Parvularcula sp. LCG005 TaxID=3078805 RepID=UPI002941C633|nr:Ig-like domain-containing protein [Parvularcula sp. LCG005]WOI53038.1 Ig-like domain-containing protein [Parvularcula sp. LCG005]